MTPPAPDLRDQLQRSLGDAYRLERELGGGGMSRVFVAVETAFDRHVVIKVLLPELAAGVSVDRFRREIQLAAQLQHPHIVPLLAAGESGGLPYFTMPFVVGESLRSRLLRDRELPVAEAIRLLRDVASALEYAHSRGVVHRDIKPDNVLLTHGVGVVTDFGVAKALTVSAGGSGGYTTGLTSLGVTLGTPAYMAPEQASADPGMDHRVDVYAFGIMAYEMLAGQTPFAGRSPQAILGAHLAALPEPVTRYRPGIPPVLAALIMRCLEKHAADRPQTATDVIAALDTLTTPSGGTVPVQAVTAPTRRGEGAAAAVRGRPVAAIAAGIAVAAAVGVWIWSSRPAREPARAAMPAGSTATGGGGGARESAAASTTPAPAMPPPAAPAPSTAESARPSDTTAARAAPQRAPPARQPEAAADAALLSRLRDEARSARRQAAGRGVAPEALARGDSAVARAESLHGARRTADAAAELSVAIAMWRNAPAAAVAEAPPAEPAPDSAAPAPSAPALPPPSQAPPPVVPPVAPAVPSPRPPAPAPPADPAPRIRALYDAYAAAVETRSLDAIRQAYPGLTDAQSRDWERFFTAVKDLKVRLHVTRLDVRGDRGDVDLAGLYVFTDPGTRRLRQDSVSFHSTVRRDAQRGWRIESLR